MYVITDLDDQRLGLCTDTRPWNPWIWTNIDHRQLGREGQEKEDHWHWPYAVLEGVAKKVQEWLPDWCTKRFEGTNYQDRIIDASWGLSGLGMAADCLSAQGIWVILANAIDGIQLQRQTLSKCKFGGYNWRVSSPGII